MGERSRLMDGLVKQAGAKTDQEAKVKGGGLT